MNPHRFFRSLVAGIVLLFVLSFSPLEFAEVAGQDLSPAPTSVLHTSQDDPGPHPILGDVRVRQALAHCTDKQGVVQQTYPFLDEDQVPLFARKSFLAPSHWAYVDSVEFREFDPVAADELLTQAGWVNVEESDVRVAEGALYVEDGTELSFELTVLDSQTRRTWIPVLADQWGENCGVNLQVNFVPGTILLNAGAPGSLARRDFEAVSFAWTTGANPPVGDLYGCDSIPTAADGWDGQNFAGYCNPELEQLFAEAQNLPGASLEERAELYLEVHKQLYEDAPYLWLFTTPAFYGATSNLQNFDPQPIDQDLWNMNTWTLPDVDTLVIDADREPTNLLTDRSPGAQRLAGAIHDSPVVHIDYEPQANSLTQLPTAANGGVQVVAVDVQAGDVVFTSEGNRVTLGPGVEIKLADNSVVVYQGGTVQMNQIVVNYEFNDNLRWSDGVPVTAQDFQFAYDAVCSSVVGVSARCDPIDKTAYTDNGFTITLFPGYTLSDFSVPPFTYLPAHQIIQSDGEHRGKALIDVPFEDWLTLSDVTDTPLTTGPYQVTNWIHGQQMVLTANPFYRLGPPNFDQVIVRFDLTNEQAYQGLVIGTVHVADGIAGTNTPSVTVHIVPGTTWEHIDFNLQLFDQTASRVISDSGGTISNDLGLTVNVPAGAFDSEVRVIINHLARSSLSLGNIGTPIQIFDVSLIDSSEQPISSTLQPLELTFAYSDTQVGGLIEEELNVMYLDGATWEALLPCDGCSVNLQENQVTIRTSNFSEFALVGRSSLYTPLLYKE